MDKSYLISHSGVGMNLCKKYMNSAVMKTNKILLTYYKNMVEKKHKKTTLDIYTVFP